MSAIPTAGWDRQEAARRVRGAAYWLAVLLLANALILLRPGTGLQTLGALLIFCVIPGQGLIALVLPDSGRGAFLRRLLLGIVASYVLSNLTTLALTAAPGGLSLFQLLAGLDLVTVAVWVLAVRAPMAGADWGVIEDKATWVYAVILLAVLCVTRFIWLGYSHLNYADEAPILALATRLIEGHGSVLLDHGKGPTEVLTALAFVLSHNGYQEFAVRAPFALASVASVLLLFFLGREMFSMRAGFFGAFLLAIEGLYLGRSRWMQYQSIVILMAVAATYCFWRANSDTAGTKRAPYMLLGSAFFAFGCLTHYGGIVVAPALALLCFSRPRTWNRNEVLVLTASAVVVLAICAPFYVPFFLSSHLGEARSYYFGERLGWTGGVGVYNNLREFISSLAFLNSTYYVAFMWLTLLGALGLLWRHSALRRIMLVAALLFVMGLGVSGLNPALLQVGNVNLAFLSLVPILAVISGDRRSPLASRAVWMWFLTGFCVLNFFSREPGSHWYIISPPWAMLGGLVADQAFLWATRRIHRPLWRRLIWVPVMALGVLFGGYVYLFFFQLAPAYARTFPENKSPLYWTPQQSVPGQTGIALYGVPNQGGWKVIDYLYRTGQMRGSLRGTDTVEALEWYAGRSLDKDLASKYILYTGKVRSGFNLENIEATYTLIGRVWVRDQPKIHIYERKDLVTAQEVADYHFEDYEPLYDAVATLDERVHYDAVKGSGNARVFFRAAGLVEQAMTDADAVLFTDRRQVAAFSQYYAGNLPYTILGDGGGSPDGLDRYLATTGSNDSLAVVFWAEPGAERAAWENWLARPTSGCEGAWQGNAGLAVCRADDRVQLHLLQSSRIGEYIELLGYETVPDTSHHVLKVVLYWAATVQPGEDYTVFTHVLDTDGRMVGQQDSPPAGGQAPTSLWRTDKVIRDEHIIPLPATSTPEYGIEVGMYRPSTGERLVTNGQGALPEGRIRLPQPSASH